MKTQEAFKFAHPAEVINATQKYCDSHYGNLLWDLRGDAANMLYASWRTNIKMSWNVPRTCKRYFIHSTLAPNEIPPEVSLMTRQVNFFHSLLNSDSSEIRLMSRLSGRDIRCNLGSNLDHIRRESGLDPWLFGAKRVEQELLSYHTAEVPASDRWRIGYLDKLLSERLLAHYNGHTEQEEGLSQIINSLVSS